MVYESCRNYRPAEGGVDCRKHGKRVDCIWCPTCPVCGGRMVRDEEFRPRLIRGTVQRYFGTRCMQCSFTGAGKWVEVEGDKERRMPKKKCADCGEFKEILAKDLCKTCYSRDHYRRRRREEIAQAAKRSQEERKEKSTPKREKKVREEDKVRQDSQAAEVDLEKVVAEVSDGSGKVEVSGEPPRQQSIGEPVEGALCVCLEFKTGRDRQIYERLVEIAEEDRRSPDQEILFLLETVMDREKETLGDMHYAKGE